MPSQFPDDWLPADADRLWNVFSGRHAIRAGMSKRQVYYRLKSGLWVRIAGVGLRHRDHPATPQMRATAAVLTWPDAVVCGPSAAQLFGAPIEYSGLVHVIEPTRHSSRLGLQPHDLPLTPQETLTWATYSATSRTRSFLDALAMLPEPAAHSLFVWAFTRNRLTASDLQEHLARAPRRWGTARLRGFLADAHAGVMSPAEALAHKILHRAGICGWTANTQVRDRRGIIGSADILFSAERLVIEIDGRRYHGTDRFQEDRTRQNRLIGAGYAVLRFTWQDLTRRPGDVVLQIRTLLSERPT